MTALDPGGGSGGGSGGGGHDIKPGCIHLGAVLVLTVLITLVRRTR